MTKSLKAALISFALAVVFLLVLLDANGLTQEQPWVETDNHNSIWVSPKFWTESKEVRYYPDGHVEYVTHGWWFEKSPNTFPGEPGAVDVTKSVYDMLLRPWVNGRIAPLCRFGFVDGERAASQYDCEQGYQTYQPVTIK